jgi:ABC-2 type transport system permease protein
MPGSLALDALRRLRRGMVWWALGLVALAALQLGVYPTVRDESGLSDLVRDYPDAVKELFGFGGADFDYTSAAGYLGAELFGLVVPLLLIIVAVSAGARGFAGEEERGHLETILSLPVGRRRVVLEGLAAMAAEVLALGVILLIALLVGAPIVGMHIASGHLAAAVLAAVLLAVGFGAVAMAVGAATGSRAVATGAAAALALAGYLVDSLGALVPWLHDLGPFTPFHHYSAPEPLRTGVSLPHLAALLVLAAAGAIAALVAVERRDIGT